MIDKHEKRIYPSIWVTHYKIGQEKSVCSVRMHVSKEYSESHNLSKLDIDLKVKKYTTFRLESPLCLTLHKKCYKQPSGNNIRMGRLSHDFKLGRAVSTY